MKFNIKDKTNNNFIDDKYILEENNYVANETNVYDKDCLLNNRMCFDNTGKNMKYSTVLNVNKKYDDNLKKPKMEKTIKIDFDKGLFIGNCIECNSKVVIQYNNFVNYHNKKIICDICEYRRDNCKN